MRDKRHTKHAGRAKPLPDALQSSLYHRLTIDDPKSSQCWMTPGSTGNLPCFGRSPRFGRELLHEIRPARQPRPRPNAIPNATQPIRKCFILGSTLLHKYEKTTAWATRTLFPACYRHRPKKIRQTRQRFVIRCLCSGFFATMEDPRHEYRGRKGRSGSLLERIWCNRTGQAGTLHNFDPFDMRIHHQGNDRNVHGHAGGRRQNKMER